MGFNLPDFLNARLVSTGLQNAGQNLQQGMALPGYKKALDQQRLAQELANKLQATRLPYEEQRLKADIDKTQAEAEKVRKFGALGLLSGKARELMSLQALKNEYGEESPVYQDAKRMLEKEQANIDSQIRNRDMLTDTASKRFATKTGKTAEEAEDIELGYFPGHRGDPNFLMTPEQQEFYSNQIGLEQAKSRSDPFTRRGVEYGTNIDVTLQGFDPEVLTMFSGGKGAAEKKYQEALGFIGSPQSQEYLNYQVQKSKADALGKQLRQLWGDSVTPSNQEAINVLVNPESITMSPEVAKAKVLEVLRMVEQDKLTFQRALNDRTLFDEIAKDGEQLTMADVHKHNTKKAEQEIKAAKEAGRTEVRKFQGRTFYLTPENAKKFDIKIQEG